GHAHGEWRADVAELRLEGPFRVEDLNPLVAGVGDVDVALRVDADGLGAVELAVGRSGRSPLLQEAAVLVEPRDAVGGPYAVGDVGVRGATPRALGGPADVGPRLPGSGGPADAAPAAALAAAGCPGRRPSGRTCRRRTRSAAAPPSAAPAATFSAAPST